MCFQVYLHAAEISYPGLFGKVVHMADDDTLIVRKKLDYRNRKTAALPPNVFVGVDQCEKREKTIWCSIFHIAQRDYEGFGYGAKPGWGNTST